MHVSVARRIERYNPTTIQLDSWRQLRPADRHSEFFFSTVIITVPNSTRPLLNLLAANEAQRRDDSDISTPSNEQLTKRHSFRPWPRAGSP